MNAGNNFRQGKTKAASPCLVELRFPVHYDGQEGNEIRMPDKNTVETCCLLERLRNAKKDHISFTLDIEDYYRIKDEETDKKNNSTN